MAKKSERKNRIDVPDWVQDAIFYQIFPDRFAKSDAVPKPSNLEEWDSPPTTYGFKGGDLRGVVEHLDYLKDLGINAIYFNPIFQSTANHRYHTHDYYRVDPILGGDAALRKLIKKAHKRGIRVILDGVFNHASRGFFQFNHILENEEKSPYLDWFTIKGFPLHAYDDEKANYKAWWNLKALPKLNTDIPAVREFIFDVARYWIEEFGIDGWRLDVPGEIAADDFWREFRAVVKEANPDAYIVGEIWMEAQRWLRGDMFDATMNYIFAQCAMGYFIGDNLDEELTKHRPYYPIPRLNAKGFAATIEELMELYAPAITRVQLNLLDSHDTARFLSIARGDVQALKLATLFQMTYPGAPCIYYGDEIGMEGHNDPDCRRAFTWNKKKWDKDLHKWFKRAIKLRKKYPALRGGKYRVLYARGDVFAFERSLKKQRLVVVFNVGEATQWVAVPVKKEVWFRVWGRKKVTKVVGGKLHLKLAPRAAEVWKIGKRVG